MNEPETSVNEGHSAASGPKRSRRSWVLAACAVAVVAVLFGVQQWRGQRRMAVTTPQWRETERRLEKLKVELEAAKAKEDKLQRRLDKVRGDANHAPKEQQMPLYFDHAGWRNDTGEPGRNRVRPLPADPSQRRPEERDPDPW